MGDLQVNTPELALGRHLILVIVSCLLLYKETLFSLQLQEIIHHNHSAFKLGFVHFNESVFKAFLLYSEPGNLFPEELGEKCLQLKYMKVV